MLLQFYRNQKIKFQQLISVFKNFIWLLKKICSQIFGLLSVVIGSLSMIKGFFQLYPKYSCAKLIQIFFPCSPFGWFTWSVYYRVFNCFRKYHTHIMAGTGAGKSYLILNLILRDIVKGFGVVVIEPHSQLINHILHLKILQLNHKRKYYEKVVLLDFEHIYPPALNIFAIPLPRALDEREVYIHSVVQNYMEAFEKAFDIPHGTKRVLRNILIALFYLPQATLLDAIDILQPKSTLPTKYHQLFLNLKNPVLKRYFERDFFSSIAEVSKEALRLRLEHLLADRQIRLSMTQPTNSFDVPKALREGHIVLVKAGETIGTDTARFIGALVNQLILFSAFKRISSRYKKRFSIYLDECQNYMSQDISRGLDESRKAGLQFCLSHQRLRQKETTRDQQRALLGCGVKIYGRLEYRDAFWLCRELGMRRQENRFLNLRVGEFFVKAGWLKTRFIKFPRYFAPAPEKIGKIDHKLFAKSSDYLKLTRYLRENIRRPNQDTKQTNTSNKFKFSLHNDF